MSTIEENRIAVEFPSMDSESILPFDLKAKLANELRPGERIVWLEMPIARYFTAGSTGAFLFAIPWTAFAVFWICGAAGFQIPDFKNAFSFFPLFGVPFVLIGCGMLSAPYWTYRNSLKTVYVITDQRAIIFQGGWTTTIRSYPPESLGDLFRREKRDGTGDVIIHRRAWRDSDGDRRSEELGFLRVRKPKEVEEMLHRLAKTA